MKNFVKNYFTFNRADRNALLVLILILLIVSSLPMIYGWFYKERPMDVQAFREEVLQFELEQKQKAAEDSAQRAARQAFNYNTPDNAAGHDRLTPFPFNPNNLPAAEWQKMGLSDRQIQGIKNYEAAGGRFLVKSDMRKLFVISEGEYEVLKPFIQLPESMPARTHQTYKRAEDTIPVVELNAADTAALKLLRGIGSVLAKRIIRYRDRLGGYSRTEQLLEVEGIDTLLYRSLQPFVKVVPGRTRKMNPNEADFSELKKHPYISSNVAISIVNYRNMHGPYATVADLMKSDLIDEALFYKIAPYFSVE